MARQQMLLFRCCWHYSAKEIVLMMEYQVRILPRQVVPNPELSEEAMIGTDIPSFG
jgi:hypothetical protein